MAATSDPAAAYVQVGNGAPRGSAPIPDPTALTDAAIAKAVTLLTQYVDGKVELLKQRDEMRDREIDKLLTDRDARIQSLRELISEKHDGLTALVEERFISSERQRIEQKSDTKQAVDAALTAQKEAVREQTTASALSIAKSEAATTKQLEQQQVTVSTAIGALRQSIDEMKERSVDDVRVLRAAITDVATVTNGTVQQKVGAREDRSGLYATIGLSITVILFLIALIGFVLSRTPTVLGT